MSEQAGRRRVFMTAGLTASAAVLAMAVQAGLGADAAAAPYGSAQISEPDHPDDVDDQ